MKGVLLLDLHFKCSLFELPFDIQFHGAADSNDSGRWDFEQGKN